MRKTLTLIAVMLNLSLPAVQPALAATPSGVEQNEAKIDFPNTITFQAELSAKARITSVVLEYGTDQLTCGEVIAKAFPTFTPGQKVNASWTWEMRQSGSLPPGANIWWRWKYTDETGKESISEQKDITWLDPIHQWKTLSADKLNLHWYSGDQAFAQDLLDAAKNGLIFNQKTSGLTAESPIDLYIYANTNDLKDAILYEPSWTGGLAFPEHDIVILGISRSDLDWGRDAIVHELTHVLIGHLTFSCLGGVPTWLNEGLAVYSEGELDAQSQQQLDKAIKDNTLLSVRSLSAGFSEVPSKAYLSYSESYSIVKYLVEVHGQQKMNSLLISLRDGSAIDDALRSVYGFDVEGLDDAWRENIGAQPRVTSGQPTARPTSTVVPTIMPISGAPPVNSDTTPIPTSSFGDQPTTTPDSSSGPPLSLTLVLLGMCCLFGILGGVVILGFIVRRGERPGGKNGKQDQ